MDVLLQIEERDGIRFSWNIWPSSRIEASRIIVPLACMYSPLQKNSSTPRVPYEPLQCKGNCRSILNPYCQLDLVSKLWVCPFCYQRNAFPPQYAGISETQLPVELLPTVTTIEYTLSQPNRVMSPVFLFVVDICLSEEESQALKDSLLQILELIPQNSLVGLITFGTIVQIHEVAFPYIAKSIAFRGVKEVTPKEIQNLLDIPQPLSPELGRLTPNPKNKFILPLAQVESNLISLLEELQKDPRPVKSDHRPLRSTGVALSAAIGLLENTFPGVGGRIMVFMGGAPTQGPGKVVGDELKEPIRSHHDINKETATYVAKATKFYTSLAERAVKAGYAVDLLAASLDQTGLLEMQQLVKKTGGVIVMTDSFDHPVFRHSLQKLFEKDEKGDLKMAFNATIELITSRELKVSGAIGHMSSLATKSPYVGDQEIGISGTSAWKICAVDPRCSYAFFFEHGTQIPKGQNGMIQFLTHYQHSSGQRILRVTTVAHSWLDTSSTGPQALLPGFDQEAAAALMTRIAIWKAETEETNVLKWLDRQLIRLVGKFAENRKVESVPLQIPSQMNIYPQFMFHLRRGPLIQVFGSSPDETVFYRYYALRENVSNALIMIQPTLDAYSFDSEPVPVLLSTTSIQPNRILLLDTFFHVVVFHGETIAAWRKAGYHEKPEYSNFKELLQAPQEDAKVLMENRFPHPLFIDCDQGSSQARFLLAYLDPASTHLTQGLSGFTTKQSDQTQEIVFSEDVSLQVFMEVLRKKAAEVELS